MVVKVYVNRTRIREARTTSTGTKPVLHIPRAPRYTRYDWAPSCHQRVKMVYKGRKRRSGRIERVDAWIYLTKSCPRGGEAVDFIQRFVDLNFLFWQIFIDTILFYWFNIYWYNIYSIFFTRYFMEENKSSKKIQFFVRFMEIISANDYLPCFLRK